MVEKVSKTMGTSLVEKTNKERRMLECLLSCSLPVLLGMIGKELLEGDR